MTAKSGTRRKSRELALQMLFQLDMGHQDPDKVRQTFWSERTDLDEGSAIFRRTVSHRLRASRRN